MGLFNKLKDFLNATNEDEYGYETEEENMNLVNRNSRLPDDYDDPYEPMPEPDGKRNKAVKVNVTTQLQVVLIKPERFDDASTVADHLNAKRTVVLNMESTNKETTRRLIDFLSGVAYANGGQIKRVANSTFILTPYSVELMGNILDELENNGVFY